MSRNGSGTYSLPAGNPVVTGTSISSTWANTTLQDMAAALTDSVAADGQTPMTGDLDINSNKIVNLAPATIAGNAVEYNQFLAILTNPTVTGNLTVTGNGSFGGTASLLLPKGTTAQRPVSPVVGQIRYNTDLSAYEGYSGTTWGVIGGGGTMALQNANAVAITGGTINGTSIGATTASTGKFTEVLSNVSGSLPVLKDSTGSLLQSLATSGYQKLPNGLIMQWGYSSIAGGNTGGSTVTFPITFPTAFLGINTQISDTITSTITTALLISSVSTSSVQLGTTFTGGSLPVYWSVLGY